MRAGAFHLALFIRVVCAWYIESTLTPESTDIFVVAEAGMRILRAGAFHLAISIRAICTWYIESLLTPESTDFFALAQAGVITLRAGACHLVFVSGLFAPGTSNPS